MRPAIGCLASALCYCVLAGSTALARPSAAQLEEKARWLEGQNIGYARNWTPPGDSAPWAMDCSNTVRWFYRELWGKNLPRTASAQYEHFRQQKKFRRARPDPARLARQLQPGDFLFWEHTYKPRRKPPVTHVMIYLGRDARGRMWMTGAQGSRGVGVYEFRPQTVLGRYRWFLWFQREGRFIGYARP